MFLILYILVVIWAVVKVTPWFLLALGLYGLWILMKTKYQAIEKDAEMKKLLTALKDNEDEMRKLRENE